MAALPGERERGVRAQIEQLYREYLPARTLEEYLTADVYVSDAKLWASGAISTSRDRRRTRLPPEQSLTPSPGKRRRARALLHDSQGRIQRPATAWLSYVAQPKVPDAADTAAALTRARRLRGRSRRAAKFEMWRRRSPPIGLRRAAGGDLGW